VKFLVRVLNSAAEKSFGGIAQLVERLVRNEKARGSNPLTSSLRSRRQRERRLSRRSSSEGGHLLTSIHQRGELRLGKPAFKNGKVLLCLHSSKPRRCETLLHGLD
jgi:hypothetical protein